MKKLIKLFLLITFIIFQHSPLQAQGIPSHQSVRFGLEASYFHYEEPGVMKEKGDLYGVFGEYNLLVKDIALFLPNTFSIEGNIKMGEVNYSNSHGRSKKGIDDYIAEIRVILGKKFNINESIQITPYTGIGFRYLNDAFDENLLASGKYGYERESHYLYTPIGVKIKTQLSHSWSISWMVEFDTFLGGYQTSHLSDTGLGYPDIKVAQNDGYGLRGSVNVMKKIGLLSISMEPYMRWWNIEDSLPDEINGFIEPRNESLETGIRVGLKF